MAKVTPFLFDKRTSVCVPRRTIMVIHYVNLRRWAAGNRCGCRLCGFCSEQIFAGARLAAAPRFMSTEHLFGKNPAKPHGSKAPEEILKPLQLQAFATDPSPAPNKCSVYIIILPMFHVEH